MQRHRFKRILSLSIVAIINFPTTSWATGLFIPLQSTSEQGNARAGGAAIADDASNSYYNPAGISRTARLYNKQLVVSVSGAQSQYEFYGTMQNPGFRGLSPITQNGSAFTNPGLVFPSVYYVRPITDKWTFGMSATSVYGLGQNYDTDTLVRYEIIYSNQKAVDFGPSISYQVTPKLALALGPDLLYFSLARKSAVRTEPLTTVDSYVTLSASSFTPGWHAGALYEFTPQTRVGLSFHSQFITHLSGESNSYASGIKRPPFNNPTVAANRANNTSVRVPLASLTTFSAYHELTPAWAVMASVEYMNWSIYQYDQAFRIASPLGGTTTAINYRNLHDTFRYGFGATYKPTDKLLLRTGLGLNPGATNDSTRKVGMADPDTVSLAFGARYQFIPTLSCDAAYSHAFQSTASVDHDFTETTNNLLVGHSVVSTDVLSAQLNWSMA